MISICENSCLPVLEEVIQIDSPVNNRLARTRLEIIQDPLFVGV